MPKRKYSSRRPQLFKLLVLVGMIILTLVFANVLIKRRQQLTTSAAVGSAQLFFQPDSVNLPPDTTLNLWVTVDKPLVFARVTFTFNPRELQLKQDPELNHPDLSRVVQLTPLTEINQTGKVSFTIVAPPPTSDSSPTGTIKLGTLQFTSVTGDNVTSFLNFDTTTSQLVDSNALPFDISALTASLALNTPPSPSPVSSTSPVFSDTSQPTVNITKPLDGSSVRRNANYAIEANATDNVGINRVEFIVDDVLECTDTTAPYSCVWIPRGKPNSAVSITAKAFDQTGNNSFHTIIITKAQ